MFFIWDLKYNNYVREGQDYPSGILCFKSREAAEDRAVKYYCYSTFEQLNVDSLCEIREFNLVPLALDK